MGTDSPTRVIEHKMMQGRVRPRSTYDNSNITNAAGPRRFRDLFWQRWKLWSTLTIDIRIIGIARERECEVVNAWNVILMNWIETRVIRSKAVYSVWRRLQWENPQFQILRPSSCTVGNARVNRLEHPAVQHRCSLCRFPRTQLSSYIISQGSKVRLKHDAAMQSTEDLTGILSASRKSTLLPQFQRTTCGSPDTWERYLASRW
jgi:hypothetical protein